MPVLGEDSGCLTHIGADGRVRMVAVSAKPATVRDARPEGRIVMAPQTLAAAMSGGACSSWLHA